MELMLYLKWVGLLVEGGCGYWLRLGVRCYPVSVRGAISDNPVMQVIPHQLPSGEGRGTQVQGGWCL